MSTAGEVLTTISPRRIDAHLLVTMRLHSEAEPILIDLTTRRIIFTEKTVWFECTRCHCFLSRDLNRVLNRHTRAAHDGIGAIYRLIETTEWPLTKIMYRAQPPGNEWA